MTKDSCFEFGKIVRPHGFKGEAIVFLTTEHHSSLKKGQTAFIEMNTRLVPYQVEKVSLGKDSVILKLEDVDSEQDIKPLLRAGIYIPLTELPGLSKGQFYYHEIRGYSIVDSAKGVLGTVSEVYEMPMQDVIAMEYEGAEVLIPVNDTFVLKADHEKKELHVTLPDGLIDLYKQDNQDIPDDED